MLRYSSTAILEDSGTLFYGLSIILDDPENSRSFFLSIQGTIDKTDTVTTKLSIEMMDNKIGLQYLRARWYDPSM
ncbi:hypothetical protein [Paenibacillus sp. SI8]|uniref:hypothetical protein n=1 Tax=unclassified Paenibacillus TaxID=185978 RepID=UPI0034661A59